MNSHKKKDPKSQQDDTQELQEMLDQINAETEGKEEEIIKKSEENQKVLLLQKQIAEKEEITKKAQLDYITLKTDFDFLLRQSQLKEKSMTQDTLVKVVKKFLPFVEDLRKSLLNLSEDQKGDTLGRGVQMVYDKFIVALADFKIYPIESLGLEPSTLFHEPVSIKEVSDKKLKGKIIEVFEQGFYLDTGSEKITLSPSKVIIGS